MPHASTVLGHRECGSMRNGEALGVARGEYPRTSLRSGLRHFVFCPPETGHWRVAASLVTLPSGRTLDPVYEMVKVSTLMAACRVWGLAFIFVSGTSTVNMEVPTCLGVPETTPVDLLSFPWEAPPWRWPGVAAPP